MTNHCVVCGRPIRTGWKYCYEHRNTASPYPVGQKRHYTNESAYIFIFAIIMFFVGIACLSLPDGFQGKAFGVLMILIGIGTFCLAVSMLKNVNRQVYMNKLRSEDEKKGWKKEYDEHWHKGEDGK